MNLSADSKNRQQLHRLDIPTLTMEFDRTPGPGPLVILFSFNLVDISLEL